MSEEDTMREALERIVDPIGAMRRDAEKVGRRLEGSVAYSLSNDPNYLKGIARAALSALSTPPAPMDEIQRLGEDMEGEVVTPHEIVPDQLERANVIAAEAMLKIGAFVTDKQERGKAWLAIRDAALSTTAQGEG